MTQGDYIKIPKSAVSSMLALLDEMDPQSQYVLFLYTALAKDIIRMYKEQT